jgi:hypothetical protein
MFMTIKAFTCFRSSIISYVKSSAYNFFILLLNMKWTVILHQLQYSMYNWLIQHTGGNYRSIYAPVGLQWSGLLYLLLTCLLGADDRSCLCLLHLAGLSGQLHGQLPSQLTGQVPGQLPRWDPQKSMILPGFHTLFILSYISIHSVLLTLTLTG